MEEGKGEHDRKPSEESGPYEENHQQSHGAGGIGLVHEWKLLSGGAKLFVAKAAIIASIGGLLFGYDIGIVEGALPQLRDEMHLRLDQQDMVVSTMVVGAITGSIVAGLLADHLGRWLTIVLTDFTFIAGGIILSLAQNTETIFAGRFVVGVGVAVSAVADVSYLSEVAPRSLRGAMVSTNELAIAVGMLGAFLAGHVLRASHGGWRIMFGFSSLLAVLQLLGMAFMPLSPRWLITKGRRSEALAVLLEIRNSQDEAHSELRDIELNDPDAKSTVKELLSKWPVPLLITALLAIFQQLSGHTNVLNFTADIFEVSGFEGPAPAVTLGFVKVVATAVAIVWVDHFGRKPFLLWGSVGMMCSLLGISVGFAISSPGVSFFACCTLVAAYALSFGPVTWLVTAEMFPAGIRGKALGVGQVGSFLGNLAAAAFFLRILHTKGGEFTFLLFALIVFVAVVFIAFIVPETKGKEPAQIARDLPVSVCPGFCCPRYTDMDILPLGDHDDVPGEELSGRSDNGKEPRSKWS